MIEENRFGELECGCGGLYHSTNKNFHTGEYLCDSCNKIVNIL